MTFEPSNKLQELCGRTSRLAPDPARAQCHAFPRTAASIPDKTEYLSSELRKMGEDEIDIEFYLADYAKYRTAFIRRFDRYRPFFDFCWDIIENWPDNSRDQDLIIYPLYQVAIVAFFAFAAGAEDCSSVSNYWHKHNACLQALFPDFPSPRNVISESRVKYCLELIDPEAIKQIFEEYFNRVVINPEDLVDYQSGFAHSCKTPKYSNAQPDEPLITLGGDGQTVQGASRKGLYSRNVKGTEVASVFDCTNNVTLSYEIKDKKCHETNAFAAMFKELGILQSEGAAIFICDALNSTKKMSSTLVEYRQHYLFPIKQNGGNKYLSEELKNAFDKADEDKYFNDVPEDLRPREFETYDHGRYETITISIMPVEKLANPSVNKHEGTQCIVRKIKKSSQVRKRSTTNEEDAKRREKSIREGAERPVVTTHYYICSLPYSVSSFNQIILSLDCYWRGVEATHGKLDRYALNQDRINGCSDRNYLKNRVGLNKLILSFLTFSRQELTQEKYDSPNYHPRKPDAVKRPIPYASVMRRLSEPFIMVDKFCKFWTKVAASTD